MTKSSTHAATQSSMEAQIAESIAFSLWYGYSLITGIFPARSMSNHMIIPRGMSMESALDMNGSSVSESVLERLLSYPRGYASKLGSTELSQYIPSLVEGGV